MSFIFQSLINSQKIFLMLSFVRIGYNYVILIHPSFMSHIFSPTYYYWDLVSLQLYNLFSLGSYSEAIYHFYGH